MFLNYQAVMSESIDLIDYCCTTCDHLSIITVQKKPYNSVPTISHSSHFDALMQGFLTNQILNIREWHGTISKGKGARYILSYYRITSKVKAILKEKYSNIFSYQGIEFPQDICFYRKNDIFISSTTHEKIVCLNSYTREDLTALKSYITLENT